MKIIIIEILLSLLIVFFTLFITHYAVKNHKKSIRKYEISHPNSISIFRMPLSFLSIYLFHFWFEIIWVCIFVFAAITDASDWIIARWCNLVTKYWKSLDPLSDKIFYLFPLAYFTYLWKISVILFFVFFIIDFFGQYSRIILEKLKIDTKANSYWKFKTTFVFILVFYLLIIENNAPDLWSQLINNSLMIFAIIFAILSVVFKFIWGGKIKINTNKT